jgi:hypothetical protein
VTQEEGKKSPSETSNESLSNNESVRPKSKRKKQKIIAVNSPSKTDSSDSESDGGAGRPVGRKTPRSTNPHER